MKFSSRVLRKGPFLHETRQVLRQWNISSPVIANINAALRENSVSVKTEGWRKEIRSTLNSWLTELSQDELLALSTLAKSQAPNDVWSSCLHWHYARSETLYYRFVTSWLFTAYKQGMFHFKSEQAIPFVSAVALEVKGDDLSDYGVKRAARDLFRTASEFRLLTGNVVKEFTPYSLPEPSFLYVLHALQDLTGGPLAMVESPGWHMFMMDESDVVRELLRLHQFKRIHYEAAGSLIELKLPSSSLVEYAKGM